MAKINVYDEFFADAYFLDVVVEGVKRGILEYDPEFIAGVKLKTSWGDLDDLREEMHAAKAKLES